MKFSPETYAVSLFPFQKALIWDKNSVQLKLFVLCPDYTAYGMQKNVIRRRQKPVAQKTSRTGNREADGIAPFP